MARSSTARKQSNAKSSSKRSSSFLRPVLKAQQKIRKSFNDNAKAKSTGDTMLEKLFVDTLKDTYWAENHLIKTLPKMEKAATSEPLKAAFADHLKVTKTHAKRLEQVFKLLDVPARGKKCEAMIGLTEEGKTVIEDTETGTATRDVGLIIAAQKVEHYEIAAYGGLAQLARTLGQEQIADILDETLSEEKETDQTLTEIAENDINYQAEEEGQEDEE